MVSSLSPISASKAYQTAKQLHVADVPRMETRLPVDRPSFSQLLENTAKETVQTIRQGEAAAVAGLQGNMPVQKVVEATLAMESALKVTVALRDRVVDAYQEVLRMSV